MKRWGRQFTSWLLVATGQAILWAEIGRQVGSGGPGAKMQKRNIRGFTGNIQHSFHKKSLKAAESVYHRGDWAIWLWVEGRPGFLWGVRDQVEELAPGARTALLNRGGGEKEERKEGPQERNGRSCESRNSNRYYAVCTVWVGWGYRVRVIWLATGLYGSAMKGQYIRRHYLYAFFN